MAKKSKQATKNSEVRARDLHILAGIRGEAQIGTIRNTKNKKRYNRKKLKRVEY